MQRALKVISLLVLLVTSAWPDYLQVSRPAQIHTEPNSSSDALFSAGAGTNLHLVQDETRNGYYRVQDPQSGSEGWIYRSLVRRFRGNLPNGAGSSTNVNLAGGFPVSKCKAPYNETPEPGLDIEACGLGGDAKPNSGELLQNPVKNDLCRTGVPQVVTASDFAELQQVVDDAGVDYGSSHPPEDRSTLSNLPALNSGVKLGEGDLATLVGFLAEAHYMPKSETKSKTKKVGETVNCHSSQHESADIHISIAGKPGKIKASDPKKNQKLCQTLSAEMIPHLRPAVWNTDNLDQVIDLERPVRITGQLFFDGSHVPCKDGEPVGSNPRRLSVWEIHPIYHLDVCKFETLQKCDPAKATAWQPLSRANGVEVEEPDEE